MTDKTSRRQNAIDSAVAKVQTEIDALCTRYETAESSQYSWVSAFLGVLARDHLTLGALERILAEIEKPEDRRDGQGWANVIEHLRERAFTSGGFDTVAEEDFRALELAMRELSAGGTVSQIRPTPEPKSASRDELSDIEERLLTRARQLAVIDIATVSDSLLEEVRGDLVVAIEGLEAAWNGGWDARSRNEEEWARGDGDLAPADESPERD